eukprot:6181037-Pleurochrysis_carterae.AAC.3
MNGLARPNTRTRVRRTRARRKGRGVVHSTKRTHRLIPCIPTKQPHSTPKEVCMSPKGLRLSQKRSVCRISSPTQPVHLSISPTASLSVRVRMLAAVPVRVIRCRQPPPRLESPVVSAFAKPRVAC